jgi:hypothetical protein
MAKTEIFGMPSKFQALEYEANFKGPLVILKGLAPNDFHLVATHEDENALLNLTGSAQNLQVDLTTFPNRINGEASFFSKDGQDCLFCKFSGVSTEKPEGQEFQDAFVHVVFTGGIGRFKNATGSGIVEADLFTHKGFSQGTIKATVFVPNE